LSFLGTLLLATAAVNASFQPAEGGFVLRHEAVVPAPPDVPHPELLAGLFSVLEITPHGEGESRVAVSGVGYTDSPGHLELRAFFERGNAWTLQRLIERFASGPVDWTKLRPPETGAAAEPEGSH
jgi:hypothetical protein